MLENVNGGERKLRYESHAVQEATEQSQAHTMLKMSPATGIVQTGCDLGALEMIL